MILTQRLQAMGKMVVGISRPGSHRQSNATVQQIDIRNSDQVSDLVRTVRPHRVFYVAGYHHSAQQTPDSDPLLMKRSLEVHVDGFLNVNEVLKKWMPESRIFYAGSSHVFGSPKITPQNEDTPFNPTSAYGITKATGVRMCRFFRDHYGLFCSAGILYNHESPLRSPKFVTTKIVNAVVDIKQGRTDSLVLGDLDAEVDWGYAPDYMDAAIRMLELNEPDDFIVASGKVYKIRQFARLAFESVGLDWQRYVVDDNTILDGGNRTIALCGDNSHLRRMTRWRPTVDLGEIVRLMLDARFATVRKSLVD